MSYQNEDLQVIEKIKYQLETSELELKEKQEHFNLVTIGLIEQLETLTGFFQIMYNNSTSVTPAEIREFASRMDVAVKNLLLSAGNVLEWEKIQRNEVRFKPETIDLHSAILENINFFKHIAVKKNISVISIVDDKIKVIADREKFDHIMRNLISNGIKFTQEGGNVDISTKESGEMLKIIVEDDGMGIPSPSMKLLFDPKIHYTTVGTNNEKGNGYGLTTVKNYVELQGGKLTVESETQIGTRLSFTLPMVKE